MPATFRRTTALVAGAASVLLVVGLVSPASGAAPSANDANDPHEPSAATLLESPSPGPGQVQEGRGLGRAAAGDIGAATYSRGAVKREVVLNDPVAGGSAGSDQQRLASVRVTQDLVGQRVRAVATLRAAPTSGQNAVVSVRLGTMSGGSCHARFQVVGETFGSSVAAAFYNASGDYVASLGASRSRSGRVVTLSTAASSRIRAADWDCAYALVADATGAPLHQLYAEYLTTTYRPILSIDAGKPIQGNYAKRWTNLRIEVRNSGRGDATKTTLRLAGKGIQVKKRSYAIGKLSGTKYLKARVRLKGKKARKLTLTAKAAGGYKATRRITIAQRPRPKKLKSLSGRYFWGFMSATYDKGWDNRAVYFVNRKWAYLDFPKAGRKPKCRKATKKCKRYSYNRKRGVVRIGGTRTKINSEGFAFKRARYYPTTLPKKGTKFKLSLYRNDFSGTCGIWCTTWTETLAMDRSGRFVKTRSSISSIGAPGVGSMFSSVGPGERGRYRVIAKGRIELRFANGKKQRHTIAIEHDVRGRPSPAGEGVILGSSNFYS